MKGLWQVFPKKEKVAPSQEEHTLQPVRILEVKESGENVCLQVRMTPEFYNELCEFLEQKGFASHKQKNEVMTLLLEFGLSEEEHKELERNRDEIGKVSSKYAAMSFQTSEYYSRNGAITMGLRLHLQKNRALKNKIKEKGFAEFVPEDKWDNWDEKFISELYRRYVFCK